MNEPTTTTDIDALLRYLKTGHTPHWYDDSTRWHAALTALVAERDALRKRVSELEAHPPADRDLRERLVCAALNGILSEQRGLLNHEYALRAIGLADATLAAMRKGEA